MRGSRAQGRATANPVSRGRNLEDKAQIESATSASPPEILYLEDEISRTRPRSSPRPVRARPKYREDEISISRTKSRTASGGFYPRLIC
jgi:hypothetical protein